jgi:hypothetical protein
MFVSQHNKKITRHKQFSSGLRLGGEEKEEEEEEKKFMSEILIKKI